MSNVFLHVHNSTMVLAVDDELELQRARLYEPLLLKHASRETYRSSFPYARYAAMNPMGRCFDNAIATARRYNLRYIEGLVFCTLLFQLIDNMESVKEVSPIAEAIRVVTRGKERGRAVIADIQEKIATRNIVIGRLSHKKGDTTLVNILSSDIIKQEGKIREVEQNLLMADQVLAMLGEYEYRVDPVTTRKRSLIGIPTGFMTSNNVWRE